LRKKLLAKGLVAIFVAVGGACLETSTDLIKKNFQPVLVSSINYFEDKFFPIPENALFGINLTFYIPSTKAGGPSAEAVSATIPGALCLSANGHSIVRPFNESAGGHQTNVMMRPSGRISIFLSPQSVQDVQVYEGNFNDGDKVSFPGMPGSYSTGILTMYRLNAMEPKGPWVPVNKCMQSNTCKQTDFTVVE
jgi:hypothetical protein